MSWGTNQAGMFIAKNAILVFLIGLFVWLPPAAGSAEGTFLSFALAETRVSQTDGETTEANSVQESFKNHGQTRRARNLSQQAKSLRVVLITFNLSTKTLDRRSTDANFLDKHQELILPLLC